MGTLGTAAGGSSRELTWRAGLLASAGGVAGATAKTTVAPIERVAMLRQTGRMDGTGVLGTLKGIVTAEGVALRHKICDARLLT